MLIFPNAKINLGLFLTEKRPDGYHSLQTVFYPIKIYDAVELVDHHTTVCQVQGMDIPGNAQDNLCIQAFKALQNDFSLPHQKIVLLKNIPVGAGLGGGSADAAFVVKLANQKFSLDLSVSKMQDYVRKLGADCAFFIENKPVYAYGKGDEFETKSIDLSGCFLVLVKPPVHVSTAEAYNGAKVKLPVKSLKDLVDLPIEKWRDSILNDFEPSIFAKYPQIDEIKTALYQAGAIFALMSGSGSSVFAIFEKPVQLPELEKENQVFYNV